MVVLGLFVYFSSSLFFARSGHKMLSFSPFGTTLPIHFEILQMLVAAMSSQEDYLKELQPVQTRLSITKRK